MAGTTFRPAVRSNAKPLIGFYSESGDGKTYSALLLARGFVGPKGRIAMIETESGRGEALADDPTFLGDAGAPGYDVSSLHDDFSPEKYNAKIKAAEAAKYDALLIDSASHEWEGAGGVLDQASENMKTMNGMRVWQKPKIDHQRFFMLPLMQCSIPLVIVCMRAKFPMEQKPKRDKPNEKEWVRGERLEPKQSEDILFEMFLHGWFDKEHKLHVTKYTVDSLRDVIRDNEIITLDTGRRLAAWARGEKPQAKTNGAPQPGSASATTLKSDFDVAAAEAEKGTAHLKEWMNAEHRKKFRQRLAPRFEELLKLASDADKRLSSGDAGPGEDRLI